MEDIPNLSTKELEEYLATTEYDQRGRLFALEEYNRRKLNQISKPHWSVIPGFFLLVLSVVLSSLAYIQSSQSGQIPEPKEKSVQQSEKLKQAEAKSSPLEGHQ